MSENESLKNAIEFLNKTINEAENIATSKEEKAILEAKYNLWHERTKKSLNKLLTFDESYAFSKIIEGSYTDGWNNEIKKNTQAKIGYLKILLNDLEENSNYYLDKRKKTKSPDGKPSSAIEILARILPRFHNVARQLRDRYNNRQTLDITDEYDVQDLLHAILRLFFDDIRPEEVTPSYAGKSSRMDFLLKNEACIIEIKKTSQSLNAKELGDQLIIDIERYRSHPDCKQLVCFVYDPDARIPNPVGIENDLSRKDGSFSVTVFIFPK